MIDKGILTSEKETIKGALKKLDKAAEKVLLVMDDDNKLLGTITEGDIRRYILCGKNLDHNIEEVYNKKPAYLTRRDYSLDKAKEILMSKVKVLPILDDENRLVDCIGRRQVFSDAEGAAFPLPKIGVPVVIMAGGMGTRLEPFSRIFPKPLIPIGDKPMIEVIIDEFRKYGVDEFYLTLNYKGEMVESYFNHLKKNYSVKYIRENDSSGTAGSLRLLADDISGDFIVSNCDIIVKADFEEVLNFHKEGKAALTVLSSIQHYKIPYGIISFKEGGQVISIHEKPEYTLTVNTGLYILTKAALEFIPQGVPFDMTDLIRQLIRNEKKVLVYPVNENDYIDIGQWEEYKKTIAKFL